MLPANVKLNQYMFYKQLNDNLLESFELKGANVFQQDGAPAHAAKSVTNWLHNCEVSSTKNWPGNLNPIENLCYVVQRNLKGKDIKSLPTLKGATENSWANLPLQTLPNLALSVPLCLREVKKHRGGSTKY